MNSRAPSGVRRHEHRGLDLDEALVLHRAADGRVDRGAQAQVALHALAADVEVAVLQAGVLGHLVGALVDRERRRLGDVEDLDRAVLQLDAAGRRAWSLTFSSGRAATVPVTRTHVLAAHVDGVVDHALRDAGVVAQVDEGQVLAVLAAGGDPAAERDGLADVLGAQLAALVGAHGRGAHGSGFREVVDEIGAGDGDCRPVPSAAVRRAAGAPPRCRRRARCCRR